MDLDDMKVLLTIARTGSLTAAARELFVSQPALSKRLSHFEKEIGTQLFERGQGARSLTLTPAGKLLIPFAEKWDGLRQEIAMLHDLNSRVHFFVDSVATVGEFLLPEALYRFHRENPDTELVVERHHNRTCYASLHDRTADIAFVTQQMFYQNIVTAPLLQEQMVLLVSKGSPLTGTADTLSLDPAKEVVIPWTAEFMHWRQEHLRFTLHPTVSVWSPSQALPFLVNDGSWMMAPRSAADWMTGASPFLRSLPLSDPPPDRTVYWAEEYGRHHASAPHLLEILRLLFRDREGITWLDLS